MEEPMVHPVKTKAPGNAPGAGPVSTPAPTRPAAPDVISQARLGGDGPGQNSGRNNPSSIPTGTQKLSGLALNMRASVPDPALDALVSGKCVGSVGATGQERPISADPIKPAFGMRSRSGDK
jgi:hypothetical protein